MKKRSGILLYIVGCLLVLISFLFYFLAYLASSPFTLLIGIMGSITGVLIFPWIYRKIKSYYCKGETNKGFLLIYTIAVTFTFVYTYSILLLHNNFKKDMMSISTYSNMQELIKQQSIDCAANKLTEDKENDQLGEMGEYIDVFQKCSDSI